MGTMQAKVTIATMPIGDVALGARHRRTPGSLSEARRCNGSAQTHGHGPGQFDEASRWRRRRIVPAPTKRT